jgi:hypothetical protein
MGADRAVSKGDRPIGDTRANALDDRRGTALKRAADSNRLR